MFLKLDHQEMDIYKATRAFVLSCYRLSRRFPQDEKFSMCQQLRRAALSVHLNVAEGASRKTAPDRKRFREIARGSLIEIDALLDVASDLEYCRKDELTELGNLMVRCFQMLSKLMN